MPKEKQTGTCQITCSDKQERSKKYGKYKDKRPHNSEKRTTAYDE